MSDIFEDLDLLDGVPPWESYNDNVEMSDALPAEFAFPLAPAMPPPAAAVGPVEPVELPPHWGALMEQIRLREEEMKRVILDRRSGGKSPRPSDEPHFESFLPPSYYTLVGPAEASTEVFARPHVPYPQMPFWTAAPLPFSPQVYPVNVLPPVARKSKLATVSEVKKKKRAGRKPKPSRPRDARGLFTKSPEAPSPPAPDQGELLMGRIQELRRQLAAQQHESQALKEQLFYSQMELSQLKDLGLVKSTIRGYQGPASAPHPVAMPLPAAARPQVSSGSPPQAQDKASAADALRVRLDYNALKSKLRPTNNGHYQYSQALGEGAAFEPADVFKNSS